MSLTSVAILALGLDVDLPVTAEGVEAVDVERAEVDLQRLVQVGQRHSQRRDLGPVDVSVELRGGGAELRGHADHLRLLFQLADQLVGLLLQRVQPQPGAVLDHQLESAGHAQPRNGRGPEGQHPRVLDLPGPLPAAVGP